VMRAGGPLRLTWPEAIKRVDLREGVERLPAVRRETLQSKRAFRSDRLAAKSSSLRLAESGFRL
jgi:hypothetical protein